MSKFLASLLFLLVCLGGPAPLSAQVRHEVFLANTDHELHVYRISGEEPGKTLMIIGGIQGDEPGGYMTADLYADIHLKKGNLIVVPRANFYSILLNRRDGLTGDMNRKFTADEEVKRSLEVEVVSILKHLIAESDWLLNLHEGTGIYNPVWVSEEENPLRFGQSVIFDAEKFVVPETGAVLRLGEMAEKVVARVNGQLEDGQFRFRANNHNTLSPESLHKEQRTSATYYALTVAHIPAFGVETSKTIGSMATKINLQKLVINAVMDELGIEMDVPGTDIPAPALQYLLVRINGAGYPLALPQGTRLEVGEGDDVVVTDIIANYQRGLAADVEGFGTANDTNRPFRVTAPTRVVVRKDTELCGWVELTPKKRDMAEAAVASLRPGLTLADLKAEELLVDVNGTRQTLAAEETLTVSRGARLTLQGIRSNIARYDNEIVVNFKGFAPPKSVNDGNDLLFPIYTDQDLWSRYSLDRKGNRYPIVATHDDKVIGEFFVELR